MKVVKGAVIRGEQIGERLGYPTANFSKQAIRNKNISTGVYIAQAILGNKKYPAVFIVGVPGQQRFLQGKVETYLIGRRSTRGLYGKKLTVLVYKKIRPLRQFCSVQNLKRQIRNDIKQTRHFFSTRKKIKAMNARQN